MKFGRLACLLFAVSSVCMLPASAEDSAVKTAAMLPVRAAGVFVGITVGTPIAIARMTKKRFHAWVDNETDMDNDKFNAMLFAVPMSVGEGLAQGLFYGPRNAIVNSDKPFSKDALSLEGSPDGK
jgi:hypothetical protein